MDSFYSMVTVLAVMLMFLTVGYLILKASASGGSARIA